MDQSFDEFDMPMPGPFGEPFRPPLADPLRDPMLDQLQALENSVQPAPLPGQHPSADLAEGMDWLGYALGRIEASIEAPPLSFPPPSPAKPSVPASVAAPLEGPGQKAISPQPPSPPPGPSWSPERRWGDLRPSHLATPYFTPDGLRTPAYHPLGGGGTGIGNTDELELMWWCAEVNQPVRQADCQACEQWGDHGDGFERCRHDWLAENADTDGDTKQGHEGER
jgi:hypothetical protein